MKYFKLFNTEQEYYEYISSEDCITPNVSSLRDCTNTWITAEIHKYEDDYLTFRALESGTFSLSANDVQYSLDNGETWATLTAGNSTPTVNSGDTVLWKASNLTATSGVGIGTFSSTGNFEVEGNLLSLVYGDDFENQAPSTSSNKYYFTNLFSGNTNVINAENLAIVGQSLPDEYCRQMFHSCSNLEKIPRVLSASTIGSSTYRSMFNRCSKITTAPSIYATTIGENSMEWMFEYCTSLTTPPVELSATTTYYACYQGMFKDCTSLLYTPKLPALGISWSSYEEMFNGCTSLTAITQLSMEETSKESCMYMFSGCTSLTSVPDLHVIKFNGQLGSSLSYIFAGCTSLVTAPALPATNLKSNTTSNEYGVYKGMFQGCTSLTTAPALPATILSSNCYMDMFNGCTSLTTAPSLPAETLTGGCYYQMFQGCTSLTTAPSLPAETLTSGCYRSMFDGCTSLTTTPELPATTLASECYRAMFANCPSLTTVPSSIGSSSTTMANNACTFMFTNCTSLTTAPELPATTLANGCYQGMFQDCTSLTTVPELPATTLANSCYRRMFSSCTSLTTAPELSATTLVSDCYKDMFNGCSKLNYIECLATDISASDCTFNWVIGVASSGTFVKSHLMDSWTTGNHGIPTNWEVRDDVHVDVTGVTISTSSATIDKGNTYTLTASVLPSDAFDKSVTWSSDDTSVATVSSEGVITAVGCGEAIITVTTNDGGYTAQCTTTVENPVTGVTLDTNVIYIITGDTSQLVATVSPSDACGDKSVSWSSSDNNIATVSNNGLVTAVATGSAVITVTTTVGSYTATCAVEVTEPVAVTGVTLDKATLDLVESQTGQLVATVLPSNATDKSVTWSSSNNAIATVSNNGLVTAVSAGAATITVTTVDGGYTASCEVTVSEQSYTSIVIEGASSVSAESCNYVAIADNSEDVTSSATWSITAGSQYATIDSSNGHVTILNGANESSVTIQVVYAGLTATTPVTLTYVSGASSETETESTTDIGGNTTTVTTTVTTNSDGSSVEVVETVITDANGDLIGTSESNKTVNTDGSYNGTTTNYDANGDPTDGANVTGDTEGNVSTQNVEYDASGNSVVTSYDIDTSETTGKTFNHDGANTDYYAFDVTHGFELDIDFTIDFSNQPSGQDGNHHNILNAKRATPEPWYGFQIRHSSSSGKTIQLGTQFSGSSNVNTTIQPQLTGDTARYVLKIVYDPTKSSDTFVCKDMRTGDIVFRNNNLFPDLDALKYLKVTIGYAVNENGNPFRYSNIVVSNFSLKKLKHVANPTITCTENVVTVACDTVGANIYYRLNLYGDYSAYTTPITITADTVVQAYATNDGDTSDIIREDCSYVLDPPVISCDGENITITCSVVGADIYYRLNESGSYSAYTTPITITADTIVETYSVRDSYTSVTIKETCIYVECISDPVITCDGMHVTITCDTVGVTIYYRLNESGSYSSYTTPISITANTIVESYAELGGKVSDTVKETCIYAPTDTYRWYTIDINEDYVCSGGNKYYKEIYQVSHNGGDTWEDVVPEQTRAGELYEEMSWDCTDYSAMYFTIHSLEDSNDIYIKRNTKTGNTEYYSVDSGSTWSTMPSGSGAKKITTLNSGDTMWIKCTTSQWATAYDKNNTLYSTKNIKVYGNIMSLLYGDNFTGQTTVGAFGLCGIFFGTSATGTPNTKLVSAKNLVLPATTLNTSSYNGLFRGCTNLVDAPRVLPATTLYQDTYSSMFEGCTSLVEGPEIMATTIANSSSTSCMQRMFCMNRNSKVTAAMTKSPVLRIVNPTTAGNTYQQLFCGNRNLVEVTILAEGTNLSFTNWLNNVSSSGVIKKLTSTTFTSGANGKPSGWTTEDIDNI